MDFVNVFVRAIALIPGAIQGAESSYGEKTGAQKKTAAVEIVGAAIAVANAVSTRHIADPDKFTAGLSQIIDGVVTCMNASIWAKP